MNEHLPMHVHVSNQEGNAKFELDPITLITSKGMKPKDLMMAERLIEEKMK